MDQTCTYGTCDRPVRSIGLCSAHYQRRRTGKPMDKPVRQSWSTDAKRFWAKVDKGSTCWIWTGPLDSAGYGQFRLNKYLVGAHRLAWMWTNESIPKGLQVDHICFNKRCVNPAHLRLLTHQQNGQNRSGANVGSNSGIRGVYWDKRRRKWTAQAHLNRIHYHIGYFVNIDDANNAVIAWRRIYMPASIKDQEEVE